MHAPRVCIQITMVVLDQTIYRLRIIELEITKECNYRGAVWNEVSRNPY